MTVPVTEELYEALRIQDLNKNCDMRVVRARSKTGLGIVQIPRQSHLDRFPTYNPFEERNQ